VNSDAFDYPRLLRQALLGIVRDVLRRVSAEGLPGEHHFYLTFRTDAPGVVLPTRLQKRFPEEMAIVLQHQFWDLAVDEDVFTVGLRFDGALEHLTVPFEALRSFLDPSTQFGLRFEPDHPEPAAEEAPDTAQAPSGDDKVVNLAAFRKSQDAGEPPPDE